MGGKSKHHASKQIPQASLKDKGKIPPPHLQPPQTVTFSFKYLDLTGKAHFHPKHGKDGYVGKLLERFRDVSRMSLNDFRFSGSDSLRCHKIDWANTTEKTGFSHLPEQIKATEPWQFSISSNEHGRVHGFFIASLFCVVWIDPEHKLYSG